MGVINAAESVQRLKFSKVNNQISFHTEKALSYLQYESATYLNLQNTENVLWTEAAGYIADMYFAEKSKRLITCA